MLLLAAFADAVVQRLRLGQGLLATSKCAMVKAFAMDATVILAGPLVTEGMC